MIARVPPIFLTALLPILLLSSLLAPAMLSGQMPEANDRPVIDATTREVLLDLVVPDKHHHAVADLRPEEVEVYEDGVRQKVLVFRNVQGAEQLQIERKMEQRGQAGKQAAPAATSKETTAALNSLREINFVSVVFADIAPLNLEFARDSVLEFLKNDNLPNTYVTIYRLNRSLQIAQAYTSDKDSLVKAVNAAAKGLYTNDGLGLTASVGAGANAVVQANVANVLASPTTGQATTAAEEKIALE